LVRKLTYSGGYVKTFKRDLGKTHFSVTPAKAGVQKCLENNGFLPAQQ